MSSSKKRVHVRLKPRNKTVKASIKASKSSKSSNKACTYKGSDGSINVSKYIKCIANDTQLGKPKHIYEINDNAARPFVVFDYGGGRASIYNNQFNERHDTVLLL
jgi:tryptophanyl-tRNA synthetase